MPEVQLVLELIDQLLQVRSPELGARLKQKLNEVLVQRGDERFNERLLGFKKFSDFLRNHSDRWNVEHSSVEGDITVSMLPEVAVKPTPDPEVATSSDLPSFRNDVWQAFANPDPKRKRFWDREQRIVKHYLEEDQQSPMRHLIASAPHRYPEISPVTGSEQSAWMKEFLLSLPLHERDRAPMEAMLASEYTSSINAAFTRTLGPHGDSWRRFRTERIAAEIDKWAIKFNIDAALLRKLPEVVLSPENTAESTTTPPLRTKIHKLMELVSDDDLERLILPALLTTISLRASK